MGNPGRTQTIKQSVYAIQDSVLIDIDQNVYLQASDRRTRGQAGFFQQRTEFPAYRNSFCPRMIRKWKALSTSVTKATSLEGFRHLLPSASSTSHNRSEVMKRSWSWQLLLLFILCLSSLSLSWFIRFISDKLHMLQNNSLKIIKSRIRFHPFINTWLIFHS